MKKLIFTSPLIILALIFLAGCSQSNRHRGSWRFDKDYSKSEATKRYPEIIQQDNKKTDFGSLTKKLRSNLISQLIVQLEGLEITFGEDEISVIKGDGSGESSKYELVDSSESNSIRTKTKDGKISTYFFEGNRLYLKSTGDIDINLYFTRIK